MTAAEIVAVLEDRIRRRRIKSKNTRSDRPFVVVDAADLLEVMPLSARTIRGCASTCSTASAASIIWSRTRRKSPRPASSRNWKSSIICPAFTHRHRFVVKVILPRWKDDKAGQLPEVPSRDVTSGARPTGTNARSTTMRRQLHRPSGADAHLACRRIGKGYPLRKDYEFPLEYHGIRGR